MFIRRHGYFVYFDASNFKGSRFLSRPVDVEEENTPCGRRTLKKHRTYKRLQRLRAGYCSCICKIREQSSANSKMAEICATLRRNPKQRNIKINHFPHTETEKIQTAENPTIASREALPNRRVEFSCIVIIPDRFRAWAMIYAQAVRSPPIYGDL